MTNKIDKCEICGKELDNKALWLCLSGSFLPICGFCSDECLAIYAALRKFSDEEQGNK